MGSYPVLKTCFIIYFTKLFIMDKPVLTKIDYKIYSSTYVINCLFNIN